MPILHYPAAGLQMHFLLVCFKVRVRPSRILSESAARPKGLIWQAPGEGVGGRVVVLQAALQLKLASGIVRLVQGRGEAAVCDVDRTGGGAVRRQWAVRRDRGLHHLRLAGRDLSR
jgi:hypothetical protein